MSQNKELKLNLTELQDAFVKLSQQNMDLASDLETERHRARQLQRIAETPTTGGDMPSGGDMPTGEEVDMVCIIIRLWSGVSCMVSLNTG